MDIVKKYIPKAIVVQEQFLNNCLICKAIFILGEISVRKSGSVKQLAFLLLTCDDNSNCVINNVQ